MNRKNSIVELTKQLYLSFSFSFVRHGKSFCPLSQYVYKRIGFYKRIYVFLLQWYTI